MDVERELGRKGLVNIQKVNRTIRLDMRYATPDNITKQKLYSRSLCFLRGKAAEGLSLAQKELEEEGLVLVIWDAYRPLRVQKYIWEAFPDPRYNARVSDHNRGIAVDVTLGNVKGSPIQMPTGFDFFGERAHHGFSSLPPTVIRNRERLRNAMESHGFERFEFEWWHYSYKNLKGSEVLDIPL